MAGLDNPVPVQPSSERDLLETTKQLCKSSESIRDILFALMEVLDGYPPSVITDAVTGRQYNALAQAFGFVTIATNNSPRGYAIIDASSGSTPQISIVPSTTTDLTNSGTVWIPTSDGTSIASPDVDPLEIDSGATAAYTHSTVDTTSGFITGISIETDTGSGVPSNTNTDWYMLLTHLGVIFDDSGNAKVIISNDGWFGPISFAICGPVPLTDGTFYRFGS